MFAGSHAGAERFADQLSLVSTADAAGVNPGSYIADILPRIDRSALPRAIGGMLTFHQLS